MLKERNNKILRYIRNLLLVILIGTYSINPRVEPIEEMAIPIGFGFDVIKKGGEITYNTQINVYSFVGQKLDSYVYNGKGNSIGQTRQATKLKLEKRFIIGLEKIYVISEAMAEFGMKNVVDSLTTNPNVNDMGIIVICKGSTEDIIKLKIQQYVSSLEYLTALVDNSTDYNFWGNEFKLIDLYVREDSEGKNIVLPYVEIVDDHIELTGSAFIKKDKMVMKLNVDESKIMNILREPSTKGVFTVQKDAKKYTDFYSQVKRHVKCTKKDGNFKFVINLDVSGQIINNELYKDIASKKEVQEKFEKDLAIQIEGDCKKFIAKMKNEYKLDLLQLGIYAVSRYGRKTGVDWNEVISNSDIQVKVKVKVENNGRGDI